MALSKINNNGQTNATWRGVIDAGIDVLNSDILQANTTITVTQSDSTNESTTVCEVSGHTSATFDSSNSGSTAQGIIQAAINSLPKNMGGHYIKIKFGTTGGQTITISNQLDINSFTGGAFVIESAKTADNDDDSSTKANTIQSSGTAINRLFEITRCSEVFVEGLELIQDTGDANIETQFVIVSSSSWVDINHCVIKGGGSEVDLAILIQRGSRAYVRDSYVGNAQHAVRTSNNGIVSINNTQHIEPKPKYGANAVNGIILQAGVQISGSVGDEFVSAGGIIVPTDGIIIDETVLSASKVINFDNSMSVTDMQNIINIQPKNLNRHNLTFQFADGTYDFGGSELYFVGFEGGTLNVQGNTNDTLNADGSGLGVIIQSQTTGNAGAIRFAETDNAFCKRIRFEQTGSNTDTNIIRARFGSDVNVQNCAITNSGSSANIGVAYYNATGRVSDCRFNNLNHNILGQQRSYVYSEGNNDFSGGTASSTNIRCESGSIFTQNNIQASGGNSKEANTGGVIFDKDGALV